jgi:hypothetical protein
MVEGGVTTADKTEFTECWKTVWKTPYIMRLAFSAGIGGLLFGYDTGYIKLFRDRCYKLILSLMLHLVSVQETYAEGIKIVWLEGRRQRQFLSEFPSFQKKERQGACPPCLYYLCICLITLP